MLINSTPNRFNTNLWSDNADPFTSSLPGMSTPVPFGIIGLVMILLIKIIIPKSIGTKAMLDIKPAAIIANGLAFGCCLAGLGIVIISIPVISYSLDCHSYKPDTNDLVDIAIKYMAYAFLYLKLYEFVRPLLTSLSCRKVSWLDLIQIQLVLLTTWVGVKTNPGGLWMLSGVADAMYQGFTHGYLVLTCASVGVQPKFQTRQRIKKQLHVFRVLSVLIVMLHLIYFLQENGCPNYGLRLFLLCYSSVYVVIYWYKTEIL